DVLLSHAVVVIEVANAPDSVRRKFISPAAEAVSLSSTLASACAVIGRKKNGKPSPIRINGTETCQNVMSVVDPMRQRETAPIHSIPKHTSRRGSTFVMSIPAIGAMKMASSPVHAVARPAQVDV